MHTNSLFARGFAIVVVAASCFSCSSSGDGSSANDALTTTYSIDASLDADQDGAASDAKAAPDAPNDAAADAPVGDAAGDAADGACPCGVVEPYECKLLVDHCAKDPNCLDCNEIPKACACAPCHDGGTHCNH